MRKYSTLWGVLGAALICLAGSVQAQDVFLGLEDPGGRDPVTGNCSTWHELHPNFCVPHHQDSYEDNGDGQVSPCDYIVLDGTRFHIEWAGPTYHLDCQIVAEPLDDWNPENPICEEWIEIHPEHGVIRHVDGWDDNGDSVVGPCDFIVFSDGLVCHIQDVKLNIRVVPATPTSESSWGEVKALFPPLY